MFQTKAVDKLQTHVLCSIHFPENRTIYVILQKNMEKPDTHSEYVIKDIAIPLQAWTGGEFPGD